MVVDITRFVGNRVPMDIKMNEHLPTYSNNELMTFEVPNSSFLNTVNEAQSFTTSLPNAVLRNELFLLKTVYLYE